MIDPKKYAEFEAEILRLKSEIQRLKVSHKLETAFYEAGGRRNASEHEGASAFDLLKEHVFKFVKIDERGRVTFIDPQDGIPLKTREGRDYTAGDLMTRLRASPVAGNLFVAPGSVSSGADPNLTTREQLREIKDPATRLARARELGLTGRREGV